MAPLTVLACLFGLLVACGRGASTMSTPSELNREERAALADIARFNDTLGRGGWLLAGRKIGQENWNGLMATAFTWDHVELEGTKLRDSRWTRGTMREVTLTSADLTGAVFESCHFERCTFKAIRADAVRFIDCTFEQCTWQEVELEEGILEGCRFAGGEAAQVIFGGGAWTDVRLTGGKWIGLSLMETKVELVLFKDVEATEIVMGAAVSGRELVFEGGQLKSATFGPGRIEGVAFRGVTIGVIGFANWKDSRLRVENCPSIERIGFLKSEISGARWTTLPKPGELVFVESVVTDCTLERVDLQSLDLSATRLENVEFTKVNLSQGGNWARSTWRNVGWAGGTVGGEIWLGGASIEGLKLEGVRYGEGYRLHDLPEGLYVGTSDRWR